MSAPIDFASTLARVIKKEKQKRAAVSTDFESFIARLAEIGRQKKAALKSISVQDTLSRVTRSERENNENKYKDAAFPSKLLQQATKFVANSGKKLPLPLTNDASKSYTQHSAFKNMVREMGDYKRGLSGNVDGGFYRGMSERPITAASLRALSGYTLGNSLFSPNAVTDEHGNTTKPTLLEKQAPGVISAILAFAAAPSALTKAVNKYVPNSALSNQRLMSNLMGQPLSRLAGTAILGDITESANQSLGVPILDEKLKPTLMGLGLLSSSRPLSQIILSKSKSLQQLLNKLPKTTQNNLLHRVARFTNNSRLSGANYAKMSNPISSSLGLILSNLLIYPKIRDYTENLKDITEREVKRYLESRSHVKEPISPSWRKLLTPRALELSDSLKKINNAAGTVYETTYVPQIFNPFLLNPPTQGE
jgi:hypothetical protein